MGIRNYQLLSISFGAAPFYSYKYEFRPQWGKREINPPKHTYTIFYPVCGEYYEVCSNWYWRYWWLLRWYVGPAWYGCAFFASQ